MKDERNCAKIYQSRAEKASYNFSVFLLCFCFLIFFSLALFNAIFFPAEVVGRSMQPTINQSVNQNDRYRDTVYASSLFKANRSDIVIVDLPERKEEGIKRLIAIGGDTLSFGDLNLDNQDKIYLNGGELLEPYIKVDNTMCVNSFKAMIKAHKNKNDLEGCTINSDGSITLNKGYCVYLGDNRINSFDCSHFGPQKIEKVLAKVVIIVPYGYNLYSYIFSKIFGI